MQQLIGLLVLSPVTAIAVGVIPALLIYKKKLFIQWNYWTTSFLVLFFWSIFVSILNKSLWSALGSLIFLVYFFGAQLSKKLIISINTLHKALKLLINFTTTTALIGIAEKAIFALIGDPSHRIYSTYGNPNMTASWFSIVTFIGIYLYETEKDAKRKKLLLLRIGVIIIALLLTGSRGGYISTAGTLLVSFMLKDIKSTKKVLTFIVVLLVSIIGFIVFSKSALIKDYVLAHPFESSLLPRVNIWRDGLDMVKSKPLTGWGVLSTFDNSNELMTRYGRWTIHLHNTWLGLFGSLGIVGISIYLFMKACLYKNIIALYNKNTALATLCLSINLAISIHSIVDIPLYAPQVGILFAVTGQVVNELTKELTFSTKVISKRKAKEYAVSMGNGIKRKNVYIK